MVAGKDYIGVGCGALIIGADRKVLLVRRRRPPEADTWSIPGGKVSFGETIQNAVIREVQEELGILIDVIALLGVTDHILPEENSHWVAPAFLARIKSGNPMNLEPAAHHEFAWFDPNNLPKETSLTTNCAVSFYNNYLKR